MSEEEKKRLEQQLWKIANELRGKMDADEFRDYILGFIFYKYLSEKQRIFANKLLETEDVKDYAQLVDEQDIDAIREESLEKLGYFLRPTELFRAIAERGNADTEGADNFILEDLQAILNAIEQSTMGTESEDDFNHLFEDLDLASTKLGRTVEARNKLIAKVLSHLDKISFNLETGNADVLGDAYEYLIGQFASGAGKKAGEFYTPQQVSRILAKIVTLDKKKIKSAYDPACGSGSLLLRIAKEAEVGSFFGQELNRTTYNLARMNMLLHDVHFSRFDIRQEDTLEEPLHIDQRFEAVVANPPFSAKWKGKDNPLNETDDRFSRYGALAPSSKADFAFLQHMIHQLAENGVAAVVMPHGILFRGNAEHTIRKYLIDELNIVDAVIGLPPNLFFATDKEVCIIVLKKCRENDDNILFVDAAEEFCRGSGKNYLTDGHVDNVVKSLKQRTSIDRYSAVVPLDRIRENGYLLNIARYVLKPQPIPKIDLEQTTSELRELETLTAEIDDQIADFCNRLSIPIPHGQNVSLLKQYKRGCVQDFYSGKLGSADERSKWKPQALRNVLVEHKSKSTGTEKVFSVSVHKGLVDQVEHLGRSYSAANTDNYNLVRTGDIVYTKSPTGEFPFGIIKQSVVPNDVIVSPLYGVFRPETKYLGYWLNTYFEYPEHCNNHLRPIIQKGVKNTINISNDTFLNSQVRLPEDLEVLKDVSRFMALLDAKISSAEYNLEVVKRYLGFCDNYFDNE